MSRDLDLDLWPIIDKTSFWSSIHLKVHNTFRIERHWRWTHKEKMVPRRLTVSRILSLQVRWGQRSTKVGQLGSCVFLFGFPPSWILKWRKLKIMCKQIICFMLRSHFTQIRVKLGHGYMKIGHLWYHT